MAEFIGLVDSDLSLPLPNTTAIYTNNLRYIYEDDRRTIVLYQDGISGRLLHVPPTRKLYFPENIIKHMGLSPGRRFYYIYSPYHNRTTILIKKDFACARCGDYSLPGNPVRLYWENYYGRGVCRECVSDILKETLFPEEYDDDFYDGYSEDEISDILTEEEEYEIDKKLSDAIKSDKLEESMNGTLPRVTRIDLIRYLLKLEADTRQQ